MALPLVRRLVARLDTSDPVFFCLGALARGPPPVATVAIEAFTVTQNLKEWGREPAKPTVGYLELRAGAGAKPSSTFTEFSAPVLFEGRHERGRPNHGAPFERQYLVVVVPLRELIRGPKFDLRPCGYESVLLRIKMLSAEKFTAKHDY